MTSGSLHRVLLVGFMGSGKTSVGKHVAGALGWRFVDFDDAVEAEAGRPIREIFEAEGESAFRALEARVAARLLEGRDVVLGSGGGWAAAPGRVATVPAGTATFWLRVSAEEAIRRVSAEPGVRPLLEGGDSLGVAARLLDERVRFYRDADWSVDTEDSAVEDVSARILEILAEAYPNVGEG